MIHMPGTTHWDDLPLGTILAFTGKEPEGADGRYVLMENATDLIQAELAGWKFFKKVQLDDAPKTETWTRRAEDGGWLIT
jgi:hypothetical protein